MNIICDFSHTYDSEEFDEFCKISRFVRFFKFCRELQDSKIQSLTRGLALKSIFSLVHLENPETLPTLVPKPNIKRSDTSLWRGTDFLSFNWKTNIKNAFRKVNDREKRQKKNQKRHEKDRHRAKIKNTPGAVLQPVLVMYVYMHTDS